MKTKENKMGKVMAPGWMGKTEEFDFNYVLANMEEGIREDLAARISYSPEQAFVDEYVRAHNNDPKLPPFEID